MANFPLKPEEMTTDWVTNALGWEAGAISGITFKPIGTGQVADSYRFTLDAKGDRPFTSFVAKMPSEDPASLAAARMYDLYIKEHDWYKQYADKTDIRCPDCYFTDINEEGDQVIVLLEDCAPAEQGDQIVGAPLSDIRAALKEAAALHAPYFNKRDLEKLPFVIKDKERQGQHGEGYKAFWPMFCDRYADRLTPEMKEVGNELEKRITESMEVEQEDFSLTHNDFRIDNMLFGAPDGRVVVLDWQTIGMASPMTDVAYLLGTSIGDPKERKAKERDLFEAYLGDLRERGVSPDEDALWLAYRQKAFSGFIMAVMSAILVEQTDRGDSMFLAKAERSSHMVLDLDSFASF